MKWQSLQCGLSLVLLASLGIIALGGCGGGKQTQGTSPQALGIGPPAKPGGGVVKGFNQTATRPVPNN